MKKIEDQVDALKKSNKLPPGLAEQYDIQLSTLRNPTIPDCELIPIPFLFFGKKFVLIGRTLIYSREQETMTSTKIT